MLTDQYYAELIAPFLQFAKQEIRHKDKNYAWYGTGEAAHWAVQSNFNVAGGLAIFANLSKDPVQAKEARELALKLFRYNLYTHKTGHLKNSCGEQWGGSWISILGLERMGAGQLALEPYLTEEDKKAFRKLRLFEADWLVENYKVVASIDGAFGSGNKPESNYWNGSFLYKTAMDYPDCPNREAYLNKACTLFLNAISVPSDESSEKIYRGKPMKEWFVGANFTSNYSLDHHGYMNIGYSIITLSHAAYLHFYCKARGWEVPEEAKHHVQDLWNVVKHFIFPDGRLLRIGGDTRARYCYCQMYLLPILLMMQDISGDQLLAEFEYGMSELLRKEQTFNGDGTFFGKRLDDMSWQSRYYHTRLESDPFAALAFAGAIRSGWKLPQMPAEKTVPQAVQWGDDFHGADMIKSKNIVRSIVRRAGEGPMIMAHPLSDSSLAEWHGNGHAQFEGHFVTANFPENIFRKSIPGGFLNSAAIKYIEAGPWGEGEGRYETILSQGACAALPDGKSVIVLEHTVVLKEHSLISLRTIGWQVPNDLFNGRKRTFYGKNFKQEVSHRTGKVIETNSRWLNVDNQITLVLGYGAESFKINAPAEDTGNLKYCRQMTSLHVNEICGNVELTPRTRRMPGDILADTGYLVIAGSTAEEGSKYSMKQIRTEGLLRVVEVTAPDGRCWQFAANFSTEPVTWNNETIPAGQCALKHL